MANRTNSKRNLAFWVTTIVLALYIIVFSGCYTKRKAMEGIDKAFNNYPVASSQKFRQLVPVITTDSITEVVKVIRIDSSKQFQAKIDSLLKIKAKIKDSIAVKYKDSCREVVSKFNEGFNIGYNAGYYYGKKAAIPDTFLIKTIITKRDLKDSIAAAGTIADLQKKVTKQDKTISKTKTWRTVWLVVALIAIALLGIGFMITKK